MDECLKNVCAKRAVPPSVASPRWAQELKSCVKITGTVGELPPESRRGDFEQDVDGASLAAACSRIRIVKSDKRANQGALHVVLPLSRFLVHKTSSGETTTACSASAMHRANLTKHLSLWPQPCSQRIPSSESLSTSAFLAKISR